MVSFITRTCKVKTQTKYLSLRSSVYIILGDTRVPWSREAVLVRNTRQGWCSLSLSRLWASSGMLVFTMSRYKLHELFLLKLN